MSDPFDVAIIGGSFAGLTAALQLGRASRRTVVLDAGRLRNRFSAAAHSVPGWDGVPPQEILARFRSDLSAYPAVRILETTVTGAHGSIDGFTLDLDSGAPVRARRILLAHGIRDVLPPIPGLADGWGRSISFKVNT